MKSPTLFQKRATKTSRAPEKVIGIFCIQRFLDLVRNPQTAKLLTQFFLRGVAFPGNNQFLWPWFVKPTQRQTFVFLMLFLTFLLSFFTGLLLNFSCTYIGPEEAIL